MLTPTRIRSLECLLALEWLRLIEWLGIHATKVFKNLVDKNEYDLNTSTSALKFLSIFRGHEFSEFFHFVNHPKNFPKVATGTWSHRMSELRRISDWFGYPKPRRVFDWFGYPKLRPGTRSFPVSDYFGGWPKPDPTRTSGRIYTRIYRVPVHL